MRDLGSRINHYAADVKGVSEQYRKDGDDKEKREGLRAENDKHSKTVKQLIQVNEAELRDFEMMKGIVFENKKILAKTDPELMAKLEEEIKE